MRKLSLLLVSLASLQTVFAVDTFTFDANGVMLPPKVKAGAPLSYLADVTLTHAGGKRMEYYATANTDVARGAVLKLAELAHVDGDTIKPGNGTFQIASPLTLKKGAWLDMAQGTVVKLADQGGTTITTAVITTPIDQNAIGTKITGGTIDCNLQGQSASDAVIGAIKAWGAARVEGVTAINWGTTWVGHECFILCAFSYQSQPGAASGVYGAKLLNNIVHTPAPVVHADGSSAIGILGSNQTGANLTTPGDGWMMDPEIEGNAVRNVTTGTGIGQPKYFHAYGVSSSYGGNIHDNHATNLNITAVNQDNTAVFFDTWSNKKLKIQNNTFTDVGWGILDVTPLAGTTDYDQDDWLISGNQISSISGGVALTPGSGAMTRVSIKNNTFTTTTSPYNASAPYGVGYVVKNINGLTVEGNTNDALRGYRLETGVTNVLVRGNKISGGVTPVDSSSPGVQEETFADEIVSFIPLTAGWYRIATGSNGMGGDITVANIQTGHLAETMFHYEVGGYGFGSSLSQSRMLSVSPAITQARVSTDGGASCYLDIYIALTDATSPLKIYSRGSMMRGKLIAAPVVGAVVGSTSPNTITFGPGIVTTGNASIAGSASIGSSLLAPNVVATTLTGNGAGITKVQAGMIETSVRHVADVNYTMNASDVVVIYDTLTAARTVTLAAPSGANDSTYRVIKDGSGNAGSFPISVSPAIEGVTQKVDVAYGSMSFFWDEVAVAWRVQWRRGSNPKVYRALLTQVAAADPTVTVLENTLGGTVVWTRAFQGTYSGTLTGAFPVSKTLPTVAGNNVPAFLPSFRASDNVINVSSYDNTNTAQDSLISQAVVQILVYP